MYKFNLLLGITLYPIRVGSGDLVHLGAKSVGNFVNVISVGLFPFLWSYEIEKLEFGMEHGSINWVIFCLHAVNEGDVLRLNSIDGGNSHERI